MARTSDIGLRRDPHPPMPMVIPSRNSPTSSSVTRLSVIASPPASVFILVVSAERFSTKAARGSSATPLRFSSNVNPCSKR